MKAKLRWQEYNEWFKANVSKNGGDCSFTPNAVIEVTPIGNKDGIHYVNAKEFDGIHTISSNVPEQFIQYRYEIDAPQQ